MNDNKEYENSFKEIYPAELKLKEEDINDNVATFLDLNITIKDRQFSTKLFNKRDGFNFSRVRLPCKCSNGNSNVAYGNFWKIIAHRKNSGKIFKLLFNLLIQ